MKARLAAVLSIAGVLTAGTAAAIVNTRVLDSDRPTTATASAATSPTVAPTDAVTTAPPTTLAAAATNPTAPRPDASTEPVTTTAAPATQAPATGTPGPTQATYALGPGGSVTLDASGGVLTIVRVDPAPGWEVHDAKNESPTQVRVRVRSDGKEVRLEAGLVFGVISTSLEEDLDD